MKDLLDPVVVAEIYFLPLRDFLTGEWLSFRLLMAGVSPMFFVIDICLVGVHVKFPNRPSGQRKQSTEPG